MTSKNVMSSARLENESEIESGMRFVFTTGSGHTGATDAAPDIGGRDSAASPLELLLTSLAGCSAISVLSILRKRRQKVTDYEVRAFGEMTETYPRIFTKITVEHLLTGHQISEERYCAVSIMLSKVTDVIHTYRIMEA